MKRLMGVAGSALWVLSGCGASHVARLDDGAGLVEGSPVYVSSVRVGEVETVRVIEGHVDVEYTVDDEHQITLRTDACALATETEAGPVLIVVPGTGAALDEERPIPQCELRQEDLEALVQALGEGVGRVMRSLAEGLSGARTRAATGRWGASPAWPSVPPIAPSLPPPMASPCDSVHFAVERVALIDRVPVHLPYGGYRAWIDVRNDGDETITIAPVSSATFVDRSGRVRTIANVPRSDPASWFMPFDVPARASREVTVIFPDDGRGPPEIDRIEVQRVAPSTRPLDGCTARATGLAAP